MRRLVSSSAALDADRAAEAEFGYPSWMLMEEAGIRLQDRLEALEAQGAWPGGPVAYLAGPGNNGGDALVMARQALLRGRSGVSVVQVVAPSSANAQAQAGFLRRLGLLCHPWPSDEARTALESASVWVDGVWGTGLRGPVRGDRALVLQELETLRVTGGKPVVALDVPSGLWEGWQEGEPALGARFTLAPGWLKDFCFYPAQRGFVGLPMEVPLAFPRAAEASATWVQPSDLADLLPWVAPSDHKGRRGHVAVVGGAPGMTGALVLAARCAAASGAGLVSLGVEESLVSLVAPQVPAFQTRTVDELVSLAPRYDAWVVGPGWGRTPDRAPWLRTLWNTDLPLVLDADGLSAWESLGFPTRRAEVVITPHPGEFRRLGAGEPTVASAQTLAREKGVTVVLKGAVTWIVSAQRRAVWDGNNPALGTGGSGDCLAGVVGAFLARGLGGFEAAVAAVALHGTAGQSLAQGGWFTADQLPAALAQASHACMVRPGPL